MALTTELLDPIGVRVDADVDTLLNDPDVPAEIEVLLDRHGVVVIPGFPTDDAIQVRFGERFGPVVAREGEGVVGRDAGNPAVYHVGFGEDLNNIIYVKGAFFWHFDGSTEEVPSKASMLSGRTLAKEGGHTQFASTYDAYERLSDDEKARLADVMIEHSVEAAYLWVKTDPTPDELVEVRSRPVRTHPLVWTHRSGRKSLVLGSTAGRVVGMDDAEGSALLLDLLDRATQPEYVLTHEWSVGDLVIWDNRGTMHRATHYDEDSGRRMHRVTLVGDEPIR